ncbi:MAG: hypothetical protein WCO86_18625, partial [Planctomycetota bacterium]
MNSAMQQDLTGSRKKHDRFSAVVGLVWSLAIADWFLTQKSPAWITAIIFVGGAGYFCHLARKTSKRKDYTLTKLNRLRSFAYITIWTLLVWGADV